MSSLKICNGSSPSEPMWNTSTLWMYTIWKAKAMSHPSAQAVPLIYPFPVNSLASNKNVSERDVAVHALISVHHLCAQHAEFIWHPLCFHQLFYAISGLLLYTEEAWLFEKVKKPWRAIRCRYWRSQKIKIPPPPPLWTISLKNSEREISEFDHC